MSAKMRRHNERGQRVDLFMDSRAEDFPANSKGGVFAAQLKLELANLSALDVAKTSSASKRQQGTAGRGGMREALRQLVASVADTAKTAALDHPDIKGIFTLAGKDKSDQTLIATARAFADAAAPLTGLFVEYGLSSTFVNDLRSNADSLEHYISLQSEGLGSGVNTNATAQETLQRIAELIERLDTLIRNKYRDDHPKLAAWESARHMESAPHSKGDGNNTPPTNNS